jgi:hypothetical protein
MSITPTKEVRGRPLGGRAAPARVACLCLADENDARINFRNHTGALDRHP